jgi:hypothetical protein
VSAAPVAASACQIAIRLPPSVIASWTWRPPQGPVMTIQSRPAGPNRIWVSAMDVSAPLKTNSLRAWGAEIMNASAPTISRFGPRWVFQ